MAANNAAAATGRSCSIENKNNSIVKFLEKDKKRVSLLYHPLGMGVLEYYSKLEVAEINQKASLLAGGLEDSICGTEPQFTSKMRAELQSLEVGKVGNEEVAVNEDADTEDADTEQFLRVKITGEKEERVNGTDSQGVGMSGDPDIVARKGGSGELLLILEAGVDGNYGVKKIGQAFDYARFSKGLKKGWVGLIVGLHLDRAWKKRENENSKKKTRDENDLESLTGLIETFLFIKGDPDKPESDRFAFLWREQYTTSEADGKGVVLEDRAAVLVSLCAGYLRCIWSSVWLRKKQPAPDDTTWEPLSRNVTSVGGKGSKKVYKIFDNRFCKTYRDPRAWFDGKYPVDAEQQQQRNNPWNETLGPKVFFKLSEAECSAVAGFEKPNPSSKRTFDEAFADGASKVHYPNGWVVVIEYNFVEGTHEASHPRHFLQIAKQIQQMHGMGVVHGDIRGFNMIHPFPGDANGESCLIDFDLGGKEGEKKYPPGYQLKVEDNGHKERGGKQGGSLLKKHDWEDLASVMELYSPEFVNAGGVTTEIYTKFETLKQKWDDLLLNIAAGAGGEELLRNFGDFIQAFDAFGAVELVLHKTYKRVYNNNEKATNSPDPKKYSKRSTTLKTGNE